MSIDIDPVRTPVVEYFARLLETPQRYSKTLFDSRGLKIVFKEAFKARIRVFFLLWWNVRCGVHPERSVLRFVADGQLEVWYMHAESLPTHWLQHCHMWWDTCNTIRFTNLLQGPLSPSRKLPMYFTQQVTSVNQSQQVLNCLVFRKLCKISR